MITWRLAIIAISLWLAGCSESFHWIAPTPDTTRAQFEADDAACKRATDEKHPLLSGADFVPVASTVNGLTRPDARVQTYTGCMESKGYRLAGKSR